MTKTNILVVEDDADILELVKYNLSREGYQVATATTGEEALKSARSKQFDLILLDLLLPGIDGLELCRIMKHDSKIAHVPIIMVTAKGEEADIVAGLELGADDYMTKPFSPRVLLARVRAVLRRRSEPTADKTAPIKIDDLVIHPGRREVSINGKPVDLTFGEFQMLYHFVNRPGWVFTRYQIVNAVHGEDYPVTDRSVDVQIVGLRRKLGNFGKYIETVRGVGYRFSDSARRVRG
ncbi:MAG: DNA-binding response regulator [candidate division Zixibacteria bacterium RBG_16_53_22]|nr:MAG: DNA-binding response regulator [candidate division Zixibacteria bacterium RBG_16_53_22]